MMNKFEKYGFDFFIHDDIILKDDENFWNEIEKLYYESKELVEENYEKLKKYKYNYPLYIFIFDDFSKYMKLKIMSQLCKQSRHTRIMLIYSSQYLHDLPLDCRQNLDFLILFGDIGEEKLKKIYLEFIWRITLDQFYEIYYNVTWQKYNFLYIQITENIFRKNFNEEIIL